MKFHALAVPLFAACTIASAQDSAQQFVSGLRPLCLKAVDENMVRDMTKFSSHPLQTEKVCNCAGERMLEDSVLKRFASMNKDQRRAYPKAREVSIYLSAKFYSASLACYSDAIRVSADNIDIGQ